MMQEREKRTGQREELGRNVLSMEASESPIKSSKDKIILRVAPI